MINKILKSKAGEGYVDMCVGVIAFVMVLVISVNIFSFVTVRAEMDQIADELLDTASYYGCFGDEFQNRADELAEEYYPFSVDCDADEYFNSTYRRVQLGHVMRIEVTVASEIKGLGVFSIPVTLTVSRSGLSQKYWK